MEINTDIRAKFVYDRQGRRTDVIINFPAYQKLRHLITQFAAEDSISEDAESREGQRKRIRQLSQQIRKRPVWREENYPGLHTPEDSRKYVERIRSEGWKYDIVDLAPFGRAYISL